MRPCNWTDSDPTLGKDRPDWPYILNARSRKPPPGKIQYRPKRAIVYDY
jgi:hypothetical protein